jgi:hypothetical protein
MDILETHFLQKKPACKLYFKVNLSADSNQLVIQENNSKLKKEFNQSIKNPCNDSQSKQQPMEEIKEQLSDVEDELRNSNVEEFGLSS